MTTPKIKCYEVLLAFLRFFSNFFRNRSQGQNCFFGSKTGFLFSQNPVLGVFCVSKNLRSPFFGQYRCLNPVNGYIVLLGKSNFVLKAVYDSYYRANAALCLKKRLFCSLHYNFECVIKWIKDLRNRYLILGALSNTVEIPVNGYKLCYHLQSSQCHKLVIDKFKDFFKPGNAENRHRPFADRREN